MNVVVAQEVYQGDGQTGGEGATALPTPEDAVVVLDQPEQGPEAELVGLVLGQVVAAAQMVELLLDKVEVLFEEFLAVRRAMARFGMERGEPSNSQVIIMPPERRPR